MSVIPFPPAIYFFEAAFVMAAITYYVGIILMLFPTSGFRRRGTELMYDSMYSIFVFLLFTAPGFLLNITSSIVAGGNLNEQYTGFLYPWLGICDEGYAATAMHSCGAAYVPGLLQNIVSGLAGVLVLLLGAYVGQVLITIFWSWLAAAIGTAIEPFGLLSSLLGVAGGYVTGITGMFVMYYAIGLGPVLALGPVALFMTLGVYYLAKFIQAYWMTLIAWGACAFIFPFKLGRKLGAAVIATSLILYIALPAMPIFVDTVSSTGAAQQALAALQSSQQSMQGIMTQYKLSSVYFTFDSRGISLTDYFMIKIRDVHNPGRVWQVWTDKNGYGDYPLPTGDYEVFGVEYLGVPVKNVLTEPAKFHVEQSTGGSLQVPLQTASLRGIVDIYMFNLTRYQLTGAPAHPQLFTAPFFFDMNTWRGGAMNGSIIQVTQETANVTVCAPEGAPKDNQFVGTIFMPGQQSLMGGSSSTVLVSLKYQMPQNNEEVSEVLQLTDTGISSDLGLGRVYSFSAQFNGCHALDLAVQQIGWKPGTDYQRQVVDPTGYTPPKLTPDQAAQAESSLDSLVYYFAAIAFLPAVFVMVVLVGLSAGLAQLIMRRQF